MKTVLIFLMLLVSLFSCKEKEKPIAVVMKTLNYPSASAVEYVNSKLYIMGDDATQMLVLDTNFNVVDSIKLFDYPGRRIPKSIKHDIESILYLKDSNQLILFGSGSLSPHRDSILSINIGNGKKVIKSFAAFHSVTKTKGIRELNIEGATYLNGGFAYSNRGHLGIPANHIIITNWLEYELEKMAIIPFKKIGDSSSFTGLSGLTYSSLNDALLIAASTEKTASVYEDGAIGKSYVWIIKNTNSAFDAELKPDKIIDLEEIDSAFKSQKIESVTILNETKDTLRVVLVADNDNGSSNIFKLSIKLN